MNTERVVFQGPDVQNEPYQVAELAKEGNTAIALADRKLGRPSVSVVVPTRNEAENIDELVRHLERVLSGLIVEIVFVDDSDDQTPQAIEAVRARSWLHIVLIHRPPEQQIGGLGGAVIEGLRAARLSPDEIPSVHRQERPGRARRLSSMIFSEPGSRGHVYTRCCRVNVS